MTLFVCDTNATTMEDTEECLLLGLWLKEKESHSARLLGAWNPGRVVLKSTRCQVVPTDRKH